MKADTSEQPPRRRKPSRKLTFEDAVQVWIMIWDGELQSRIAAFFDVNSGRISEIHTGQRWPGSEDAARALYARRH